MGVIYRNGTLYGGEESKKELVFENFEDFPENGNEEFLYIAKDTNKIYRFENENWIEIGMQKSIQADKNEILVGDGQDWSQYNEAHYFITGEQGQSEISTLNSSSKLKTASSFFETKEKSKASFYGNSNISIGESRPMSASIWGNPRSGPILKMEGISTFQMLDWNNYGATPFFSMWGDAYVDIQGYPKVSVKNKWNRASDNIAKLGKEILHGIEHPFQMGKNLIEDSSPFPYIVFRDSPTVIMDGASVLRMSEGAALVVGGKCNVSFSGFPNEWKTNFLPTTFLVEPGSFIKIAGGINETRAIAIIESGNGDVHDGQILFSTNVPFTSNGHELEPKVDWNFYLKGRESKLIILKGTDDLFESGKVFIDSVIKGNFVSEFTSKIVGPTFLTQGTSRLVIGDMGYTDIRIGSYGFLGIDWTEDKDTSTRVKIGGKKGAVTDFNFIPGSESYSFWGIQPDVKSNTVFLFEPHGNTSIKISPENNCGISFTPKFTDIVCQWSHFRGIFNGIDVFFEIEDNAHVEMWENSSFIMRGDFIDRYAGSKNIREMEWTKGHLNKSWCRPKQTEGGPIIQTYDNSNFIMRGYNSFAKNYFRSTVSVKIKDGDSIDNYYPNYPSSNPETTEGINILVQNYIEDIIEYFNENNLAPGKENFEKQSNISNWSKQDWIDYLTNEDNQAEIELSYYYSSYSGFNIRINTIPISYTSVVNKVSGSPLLELNHNSEVRLNNETYIKTERNQETGEMEFTIGGNGDNDETVTFTAKQIKQLLNILSPITQEAYDQMLEDNEVEEGTPYFIV